MRGQTAVEYLLVFSTALMIIALVSTYQMVDPAKTSSRDTLYLSQARAAVNAIGGAIDAVVSNGPGAVMGVSVQLDISWDLSLDNAENYLRISIDSATGVDNLLENVRYEIENLNTVSGISAGFYTVIVEWSTSQTFENIRNDADDNKIYIFLSPRGR